MKALFLLVGILIGSAASASSGLVIHTAEFGVGKFHRQDNKVHRYEAGNAWSSFILKEGADTNRPLTQKNADGSFTVFFSTLDELIANVTAIAKSENKKVSVLNVHGHGMPGAMWFPANEQDLRGIACWQWSNAASGSDMDNYNQYYSAVSVDDIRQMRQISNNPTLRMGCTVGLPEWQQGVAKAPEFKNIFAEDAQIHFVSCIVGLGTRGDAFTKGVAELLLPKGGRAYSSMNFGLGDWSMPQGMGFWDMQSEEQVNRDGVTYVANKRDSEIAQKGTIRVASNNGAAWVSALLANRDFLLLSAEPAAFLSSSEEISVFDTGSLEALPSSVRVPGTNAYVGVELR
ncbi:MAG: hypothetical protein AB7K68_14880 [Bacteriovoracia bacterium]